MSDPHLKCRLGVIVKSRATCEQQRSKTVLDPIQISHSEQFSATPVRFVSCCGVSTVGPRQDVIGGSHSCVASLATLASFVSRQDRVAESTNFTEEVSS